MCVLRTGQLISPDTHSRKCKEGHAYHTEGGCQQASVPCLGNLVAVADGGESDLCDIWEPMIKVCAWDWSHRLATASLPAPTTEHRRRSQTPRWTPSPRSRPGRRPGSGTGSRCTRPWWAPAAGNSHGEKHWAGGNKVSPWTPRGQRS